MTAREIKNFLVDDGTGETYPPNLYDYRGFAQGVNSFDEVTDDHIAQFHQQGFLVIYEALTVGEVQTILDAFMDLISGQNPEFTGIMFEKKAAGLPLDSLPPEQKQDYVRKFMYFVEYDARLKAASEHPKLLNVITRIIGEPPELFQDMALLKPPQIGREKPWHQDHAYFDLPLEAPVVGAWIALDEATPENGCVIINPGTHRQGPLVHFQRRDWQICDTDISNQGALAVPLKPGGCLLFHSLLQHGTPVNHSPKRRRAIQFHYKPASVQLNTPEERLAIFGEEGKNVTC